LIQSGIAKLLSLFPDRDCDPYIVEQYNRVIADELAGIKDFLALHYHSTKDRTEPLWTYCRHMPLPETLIYREEHFVRSGRIVLATDELFKDASWFAVLLGQGHRPRNYNPLLDSIKSGDNLKYLRGIKDGIQMLAAKMPDHLSFLA